MDPKEVWEEYEPKVRKAMERWRADLIAAGLVCDEPEDWTDEEYLLVMTFKRGAAVGAVEVYLTEEKIREGEGTGLSWYLNIVAESGRILGCVAPYNYSPRCWTDDPEELRARWRGIEGADIVSVCLRVEED